MLTSNLLSAALPPVTPTFYSFPSPQSIVAAYSANDPPGSASQKVATVPENPCPSIALALIPAAYTGGSGESEAPGPLMGMKPSTAVQLLSPLAFRALQKFTHCWSGVPG